MAAAAVATAPGDAQRELPADEEQIDPNKPCCKVEPGDPGDKLLSEGVLVKREVAIGARAVLLVGEQTGTVASRS